MPHFLRAPRMGAVGSNELNFATNVASYTIVDIFCNAENCNSILKRHSKSADKCTHI